MSVVQAIVDDVDSTNTLYRNVQLDGTYSIWTDGTYELTYYVYDSDGNESNLAKLRLIVGEEEE